MKISTKGRNAMQAMLYMAVNRGYEAVSAKTISENIGVSEQYLLQIFHKLKKAGLIDSLRGAEGGYYIKKQFDEITAFDILDAVEFTLVPVQCVSDIKFCKIDFSEKCLTRNLWVKARDTINGVIQNITLKDLVKEYLSL